MAHVYLKLECRVGQIDKCAMCIYLELVHISVNEKHVHLFIICIVSGTKQTCVEFNRKCTGPYFR